MKKEIRKETPAPAGDFSSYLDRRAFVRNSVAAGAGLALTSKSAIAQEENKKVVNVALVGCGAQGTALMDSARLLGDPLPFQMVAVCDIWPEQRTRMQRRLKAYKNPVEEENAYEDIDEMLAKQKNIDAVIVATPDFMHAPHTITALEAGKKVYCEKMMSNTIEAARSMVKAQEKTGGVLQIGHQRRSNPRYLHLRNNLFHGEEIFGRVTHAYAQWNRAVSEPLGWAKGSDLPADLLSKFGYESMEHFMNWRWYPKYGGGPISDLGAHQIDLFNWFFKTTPKSVIAAGGADYYDGYDLFDNVMTIYEYDTPKGVSRAYYQVLTTSGSQGAYEKWMGDNGSCLMSELPTSGNDAYREARAPSWDHYGSDGNLKKVTAAEDIHHKFWQHPKPWTRPKQWLDNKSLADVRESAGLDPWKLPIELDGIRPHTPHLGNFFEAARKNDPEAVACTVQDAFATCVTVLTSIDSVAKGGRVDFKPSDFVA